MGRVWVQMLWPAGAGQTPKKVVRDLGLGVKGCLGAQALGTCKGAAEAWAIGGQMGGNPMLGWGGGGGIGCRRKGGMAAS